MPKMNIDEEAKRLFEPIEVTFDEKTYTVTSIKTEILEALATSKDNPKKVDGALIRHTLEGMLGVDEGTFKKTDFKKLVMATRFINESAQKQIKAISGKNVPGEGAAKRP